MNGNASLIHQARISAWHGQPPMSEQDLKDFCRRTYADPDEIRRAELEGRQLRASGARCTCSQCTPDPLGERDRIRVEYANRRRSELEAVGVTDRVKRDQIIDAELLAGAAFQERPVTVTRTTKGSP